MTIRDKLRTLQRNELLIAQASMKEGFSVAPEIVRAVVLTGSEFTPEQMQAVLGCRNSLRYFEKLIKNQKAARNLLNWDGAGALLMAASDSESMPPLDTDDGLCTLRFLQNGDVWKIVLSSPELYERLHSSNAGIQVLDHAGNVLLTGKLDEDAELEGDWPFSESPRVYFEATGHTIHVAPVMG